MKDYEATEVAYKNGHKKGSKDAADIIDDYCTELHETMGRSFNVLEICLHLETVKQRILEQEGQYGTES